MGLNLNLKYITSLLGILKVVGIILGIIAYSTGMHAFINSEYNKSCSGNGLSNGSNINELSINVSDSSWVDYADNVTSVTSLPTTVGTKGPTSTAVTTPVSEDVEDLAPILWMEEAHLFLTGLFTLASLVYLMLYLFKEDLMDCGLNRGIDFGFHFTGIILLLISALFMGYSGILIDSLSERICEGAEKCQFLGEKLSAAVFAVFMAVIYGAICIKTYGKKFYQTV